MTNATAHLAGQALEHAAVAAIHGEEGRIGTRKRD